MSHEVKDHVGYLAWKSKIHCSLKGEEGPYHIWLCLCALGTAGHQRLHRGPQWLRRRKTNVIRDAAFPRAGPIWGWLKEWLLSVGRQFKWCPPGSRRLSEPILRITYCSTVLQLIDLVFLAEKSSPRRWVKVYNKDLSSQRAANE